MKRLRAITMLTLVLGLTLGSGEQEGGQAHDHHDMAVEGPVALFDNLGNHHHPISTSSEEAQRYFDQGLIFTYGFNHAEAVRSFREAARHDPDCAMCYWGVALALGPNINAPMFDEAVPEAYEALQKALELAPGASGVEQAYIEALSTRYVAEPVADRSHLDRAYADAMRELSRRYPDDLDAATLFAESLMDLIPWNYWTESGEPKPETAEFIPVLESVLERDPYHPAANHYYVHAVEASLAPERAEAAADRLTEMAIGIGHMIHMPAHLYARVGRWHDASVANELAIAADEAYIEAYNAQGFYPALYYPHNIHFLWFASSMEGRSQVALEAARNLVAAVPRELIQAIPDLQAFLPVPLFALVQFERWDEILAEPAPPGEFLYEEAMWHYARGRAFAAQGQLDEAAQEAAALNRLATSDEGQALAMPYGPSLLTLADTILVAELAGLRGEDDEMIRFLETAVAMQDALPYFEPPYWYYSVRHTLGAALLKLNRPAEAEAVYREDLARNRGNGWALFGLAESLRAQGKIEEAAEVERRFAEAWEHADMTLTSSSY